MVDSQSQGDYSDIVSRRKFVALTGGTGALALAGCIGGDEDGSDGTEGEDGDDDGDGGGDGDGDGEGTPEVPDETYDVYFEFADSFPIEDVTFNANRPWVGVTHANHLIYDEYAKYNYATDSFEGHLIEDWEFGDNGVTLSVRDDATWGDGTDITADDFVFELELGEYMGMPLWDYATGVEATGDYEVEISYDEGTNTEVVAHTLFHNFLENSEQIFGDYLDQLDDAEDEDEESEIVGQVIDHEIGEEPIESGPFEFADRGNQIVQLDTRGEDEHFAAEYVNFSGYNMGFRDGNQQFHQSFIAGELDGMHSLFVPPETLEQFDDKYDQILIPGGFGMGLVFHHGDEHFGDRRVRQAFAHVINREAVANNVGPSTKQPVDFPSGLAEATVDVWLDDVRDEYEDYSRGDSDTDTAASLLEDAGYSQNSNDMWEKDGEVLSAPIIVNPGWSDWVVALDTIASQLNQFGIDAEVSGTDTWGDDLAAGNFRIGAYNVHMGGDGVTYPFFSQRHILLNQEYAATNEFYDYPQEVEIEGRDGSTTSVDFEERFSSFARTQSDDEIQEFVEELAWIINQDLPMLPVVEKYEQSFLSNDGWDYPDPESDENMVVFPTYYNAKTGRLQATDE